MKAERVLAVVLAIGGVFFLGLGIAIIIVATTDGGGAGYFAGGLGLICLLPILFELLEQFAGKKFPRFFRVCYGMRVLDEMDAAFLIIGLIWTMLVMVIFTSPAFMKCPDADEAVGSTGLLLYVIIGLPLTVDGVGRVCYRVYKKFRRKINER